MSNVNAVAIIAVAAVAVTAIATVFKRKPKPEPVVLRKLTRSEQHEAVMKIVRQSNSPSYIECMDLIGKAVDFNRIAPLYEVVK
jgi:hypothetical protein